MKYSILIISFILFGMTKAHSQEIDQIRLYLATNTADTNYRYADTSFNASHLVNACVLFQISDTTNTQDVFVEIYDGIDSSLIVTTQLNIEQDSTYISGAQVKRNGKKVWLKLPPTSGFDSCYGSLKLLYKDNSYSQSYNVERP